MPYERLDGIIRVCGNNIPPQHANGDVKGGEGVIGWDGGIPWHREGGVHVGCRKAGWASMWK